LDVNGDGADVSPGNHVKKCLPGPAVFVTHNHIDPTFVIGENAANPGVDERNKEEKDGNQKDIENVAPEFRIAEQQSKLKHPIHLNKT
jgi:hypothetical protein